MEHKVAQTSRKIGSHERGCEETPVKRDRSRKTCGRGNSGV